MNLAINFWKILSKKQKLQALLVFILMIVVSILETFGIALVIPVISSVLEQGEKIRLLISQYFPFINSLDEKEFIFFSISILLVFYLFKSFFVALYIFKKSKFEADMQYIFSGKIFLKYLRSSYEFHIENNSSFLLRNVTQETDNLKHVTHSILALVSELSIIIGITLFLLFFEPLSTIILISFFSIIFFFFTKFLKKKIEFWGGKRFYHTGILTKYAMQGFGSIKMVKLLNIENFFLEKFSINNLKRANMLKNYEISLGMPKLFLEYISILAMLSIVIILTYKGKNSSDIIILLTIYGVSAFKLIPSLNKIFISIQGIQYNLPSLNLIYNLFLRNKTQDNDEDKNIVSNNINTVIDRNVFNNEIEFKNISYYYPETKTVTLNDLNFKINKCDTLGILGPSGAGKSTIIDLAIGLLKPSSGNILIDGQNIENVKNSWQKLIGYVPQYIYLTDESIKENITFGLNDSNINEEKVAKALQLAQLSDFITTLPKGINTRIGEKGIKLSGGQRQRIGIARALYNDPEVLVLDEATNQLDEKNEREIIDSLKLLPNKTIIIISHSSSALINCNKIIRISSGKIVEEKNV